MRACGSCSVRRALSFQALKTWKQSNDPDFEVKKNRILELYDIADGKIEPGPGDPTIVICVDEFGRGCLEICVRGSTTRIEG
jgi:hypothetical protein